MRTRTSLLFFATLLVACSESPPTDQSLEHRFADQKAAFEAIKSIMCAIPEKQIVMLDPEWSEPKAPQVLKDRLYPLFKVTGLSGVYYEGQSHFGCRFGLLVSQVVGTTKAFLTDQLLTGKVR
jgi:hypothetical protein